MSFLLSIKLLTIEKLKKKITVPQVGQDNSIILKSIGYTRKKIDILKKKNII